MVTSWALAPARAGDLPPEGECWWPSQGMSCPLPAPSYRWAARGPWGRRSLTSSGPAPPLTPAVLQAKPSLTPWTRTSCLPRPWLQPWSCCFSYSHPGWCGTGTFKAPVDVGSQEGGGGVLWLGLAQSQEWHRRNRARDTRVGVECRGCPPSHTLGQTPWSAAPGSRSGTPGGPRDPRLEAGTRMSSGLCCGMRLPCAWQGPRGWAQSLGQSDVLRQARLKPAHAGAANKARGPLGI